MQRKRVSSEILCGVYSITNKINNKRYIGSSKDIYGRWLRHNRELNNEVHVNRYLQSAWNKYGSENFAFDILELVDANYLFNCEQKWYDYFNSGDNRFGYNLSDIARCPTDAATIEKLKDGKYNICYEDFLTIITYLVETDLDVVEISRRTKVSKRSIYQIYYYKNYSELTQGLIFRKRSNVTNNILNEGDVIQIVKLLLDGEYSSDIAKMFNVHTNTIDDIYYHRTWIDITKDIIFPSHKNRTNRPNTKHIKQYDLEYNYIATYKSAREAQNATGIGYKMISRVCNGNRPHTHGFIFKFV